MKLARRRLNLLRNQVVPGGAPLNAPTSLSATRDGGYPRIFLEWTSNSAGAESGFKIERSTDDISYVQIDTVGPNIVTYTDTGLTPGQIYYYKVRAYSGSENSDYSNTHSATIFDISELSLRMLFDPEQDVYTDLAGTTLAGNADFVRRWDTQGSIGDYLDVAADANRPTLETNEINGRSVIRLAGTDDYLKDRSSSLSAWNFLHNGSGFVFFVVFKTTSTNPNALQLILDTGGVATAQIGFAYGTDDRAAVTRDDTLFTGQARNGAPNFLTNAIPRNDSVVSGRWHVGVFRYDPTSVGREAELMTDSAWGGYRIISKNGTPSGSNSTYTLNLGRRGDGSFYFTGDIAYIGATSNALTTQQSRDLQEFLGSRFGFNEFRFFNASTLVEHDTSGNDHNAFPALCLANNGDLVMAYMKSSSHTAFDGDLIIRISSDNGATWGAESSIWNRTTDGSGTLFYAIGGLTKLSNGDIWLSVAQRVSGVGAVDGVGYFVSSDNGATWGAPTVINTPQTLNTYEGGGVYEMANGDLLMPYYGKDSGDSFFSVDIMKSTDGGSNWTHLAQVADGQALSKSMTEPGVIEIGGMLYCLIRNDTDTTIQYATSADGGATWSGLTSICSGSGRQNLIKLSTGQVLSTIRDTSTDTNPFGLIYTEDGTNWQVGRYFSNSTSITAANSVYGQFVELEDGELAVVYANETAGSPPSTADIMFAKTG